MENLVEHDGNVSEGDNESTVSQIGNNKRRCHICCLKLASDGTYYRKCTACESLLCHYHGKELDTAHTTVCPLCRTLPVKQVKKNPWQHVWSVVLNALFWCLVSTFYLLFNHYLHFDTKKSISAMEEIINAFNQTREFATVPEQHDTFHF